MFVLHRELQGRLAAIEHVASKGVIPGELDTYELEQLIGRIKELKNVLSLIRSNCSHNWVITPPVTVDQTPLNYNAPPLPVTCKDCGFEGTS